MSKANGASFADGLVAAVAAYVVDVILDVMNDILVTFGIIGALFALVLAIVDSVGDAKEIIGHIVAKEILFLFGFVLGIGLLYGIIR